MSASVGGGEAHTAGPGAPTCVNSEVFSSNEVFSITTSRGISITTSIKKGESLGLKCILGRTQSRGVAGKLNLVGAAETRDEFIDLGGSRVIVCDGLEDYVSSISIDDT